MSETTVTTMTSLLSEKRLMQVIAIYLLGVPIVTSINGLSKFLIGLSTIGPLYHTLFSALLIGIGLLHPHVRKNALVVGLIFGIFIMYVAIQLLMGFSSISDAGQLYKWFMPLLLFVVYYRWAYFKNSVAQESLAKVFQNILLIYSVLIIISIISFVVAGFNPTLFSEGTLRFTGFSWGYNGTVNAFFICAYVNYFLLPTPTWKKIIYSIAFSALNSKTAIAYYAFVGWSFFSSRFYQMRLQRKLVLLIAVSPLLLLSLTFGYQMSIRAADASGTLADTGKQVDTDLFVQLLTSGRFEWYKFMIADVPTWPTVNLIFGNGTNIDRRLINPLWWETIGSRKYATVILDKTNKTIEFDILGHLDMIGFLGTVAYAFFFYIYPFFAVKQPLFRFYQVLLVVLSMLGGHLINNPQTGTLMVFFIFFLRDYKHAAIPRSIKYS